MAAVSVKALAEANQVRVAVLAVPSAVATLLVAATATWLLPAWVRVADLSRDTVTALSEVVNRGVTVTPSGSFSATAMGWQSGSMGLKPPEVT